MDVDGPGAGAVRQAPGSSAYDVADEKLRGLLRGLLAANWRSLCLFTGRYRWRGYEDHRAADTGLEIHLPELTAPQAMMLMNNLSRLRQEPRRVKIAMYRKVGGHPKTIELLNGWLKDGQRQRPAGGRDAGRPADGAVGGIFPAAAAGAAERGRTGRADPPLHFPGAAGGRGAGLCRGGRSDGGPLARSLAAAARAGRGAAAAAAAGRICWRCCPRPSRPKSGRRRRARTITGPPGGGRLPAGADDGGGAGRTAPLGGCFLRPAVCANGPRPHCPKRPKLDG